MHLIVWLLSCVRSLLAYAGVVEEILPRESELAEPGVANVDLVMVLVAADNPQVGRAALLLHPFPLAHYRGTALIPWCCSTRFVILRERCGRQLHALKIAWVRPLGHICSSFRSCWLLY